MGVSREMRFWERERETVCALELGCWCCGAAAGCPECSLCFGACWCRCKVPWRFVRVLFVLRCQVPPAYTETFTQRSLCTEELLHTEAFTQTFYTEESLHTEVLTRRSLYRKETSTQRSLYTEETFTQSRLYTEELLHTHRSVYAQNFLHREVFTGKQMRTETFTQRNFYTVFFQQRELYTEELLHADAFTHKNFYTRKF